jgi:membrane protease YdiL (CAAX protease family)
MWIPVLFYIAIILFSFALVVIDECKKGTLATRLRCAARNLGFRHTHLRRIASHSTILLASMLITVTVLIVTANILGANDAGKVSEKINERIQNNPWMLFYLLTIGVIAEETFFRGYLVEQFGVVFSATIFALSHITYGSVVEVIGAFLLGLILAYGFKKAGSLWPAILAHQSYNSIMFLML